MAQGIDTKIPDIGTSWEGYKRSRVEEFLKEQLSNNEALCKKIQKEKASYITLIDVDTAANLSTVGLFASAETYALWLKDKDSNADLLLSSVEIPMGSGGGSSEASYIVKLANVGDKTITATKKSDLIAKIRFTSQLYDPSDGSKSDTNEEATLQIETRMQGASEWKIAGSITIASQQVENATAYTTVDLSPYCVDGTQSVRMIATGITSEKKTPYVNITVTLTNIQITFQTKWQTPFEYKAVAPTISVPLNITGTISKLLNLKVTSANGKYVRTYEYNLGTTTYTETPYNAYIDHPNAHGLYTIEAWITSGDTVKTESVSQTIMCTLSGNTTPLLVLNNIGVFQNWSSVQAFDYAMYNPNADNTDISFVLTNLETESIIYSEVVQNVLNGVINSLIFDLEVETDDNTNFPASMSFTSDKLVLRDPLRVVVDNSENFAPTSGADFFLNPKKRNNSESVPGMIVNAMNGQQMKATFEGLSFVSDGWLVDENTKARCLRVLDGEKVNISYDAYSDDTALQGLSIEIDFATRNVTDENGILFKMGTSSSIDDNLVGFWLKAQESCFMTLNKRQYETQNWGYESEVRTHAVINIVPNLYNQGVNYVRIFLNGGIKREFVYTDSDSFWQAVGGTKKTGGIVINPQGADIDIYALRIYKKSLSATDIRQNYLASFPTVEAKKDFKEENDILGETGLISYAKVKEKKNTLLYKGKLPTLANGLKSTTCDIVIIKINDKAHSGTLYNGKITRQGSTSRKYWGEGNLQAVAIDETSKWVDGNGVDHGWCYQNEDGLPLAVKLVDKRNFASSMQSHKLGATRLYNDLYKEIVGKNEITSIEGKENCRVAVYEDPFLVFQQESEDSEPKFIGLGTFGSGKGDKPTFGYDKQKTPDMLMIEGSDNNPLLTKHQAPWISGDVVYDADDESYSYGGVTSWDYDMGNLNTITRFADAFNFIFLHSNRLKVFNGTYSQLKEASPTLDQSYCYWVTKGESGSARYDMYRWESISKTWVAGGITKNSDGTYATLNVKEQMSSYLSSDFASHETYLEWDKVNGDFVSARLDEFREKVVTYFHKQDILFFMCMIKLLAGTDNRAKNTYLWVFSSTSLIRAMQDDLDTIISTNNQGQLTKPYYIEEHDFMSNGMSYWNGEDNVFYNLMENAFPADIKSMMKSILTAMAKLGGGTLQGCWEKYFFFVQKYFPVVAYNEFARIGYEYAKYQMELGNYSNDTDPITQSLGSQEEAERQWVKNRNIYISSFAGYGEFDSITPTTGTYQLIRSLQPMQTNVTIKTAMWLYPALGLGQSGSFTAGRHKAGDTVSFDFMSGNDTQYSILGANYLSDTGSWANRPANGGITFIGSRLTKLDAGTDTPSSLKFKITSATVSSLRSVRSIDFHNISTLGNEIDFTKNTRVESIDIRGTVVTNVLLPQQEFLKSVKLPATINEIRLDGQRGLNALSLDGYEKLQKVYINQDTCPGIVALDIVDRLKAQSQNLSSLTILGINWEDVSAETLSWLLDRQTKLTGRITLSENVAVSATLKMRMVGMWGNIDDESNALYVSYNKVEIKSASLKGNRYFPSEGSYTLKLATMPTAGNDIVYVSWKMTGNAFATIDPKTGIITVTEAGSRENDDKATVTVTLQLSSGKTLEATTDVYFYAYQAQLGDYIFADGTYGNDQSLSDSTPIGVIFYIEPKERKWAIAVALKDYGSRVWGLYNSTDANNGMNGIKLGSNSSYNVYNLPLLQEYTTGLNVTDANMRDESNTANDGFKEYTALNTISDIGFEEITESMYNINVGHTILGEYFDRVGLKVGDMVARGQLNTLKIIAHRDYILKDTNVNLPIPKATADKTLAQSLSECIKSVQASHNNAQKYQQYYYPAASYCNAYVPTLDSGDNLVEKFGEGRWFMMSSGEMARCSWFARKGYDDASVPHAIFAKPWADLRFTKFQSTWYWLSSEYSELYSWYLYPVSGQFNYGYKFGALQVRAAVAFKL